ncbi:MAG TPA: rod shape-determining protein MreC [Fimbriimonadaceae bacterium]|nr:rod shape-determining protein MreC [Fimbriimonadaceae bacterium]
MLFIGLIAIGYVLGAAQTRARQDGRVDSVSRLIQRLAEPPAVLVTHMANSTSNFFDGISHAGALKRENAMLRAQAAAAADYAQQVQLRQGEIDGLLKLDRFKSLPGKTAVPAEVTGAFLYDNRITLDVGSNDGIQPGMPVISGRGLLALIQTVEPGHSEALLIVSPVTQIWAVAARNPPPAGLLRGEGPGSLYVDFLDPNAIVDIRDEIVTSGLSTRIPPNIPVGRVLRIEENLDYGRKRALVFPWASLGAAREVFVLK